MYEMETEYDDALADLSGLQQLLHELHKARGWIKTKGPRRRWLLEELTSLNLMWRMCGGRIRL